MKRTTHPLLRCLRRVIACFLAVVGVWMVGMTTQLSNPTGWLGQLGGIQTAMASEPEDTERPLWQKLLLGDSAVLSQWAAGETEQPSVPEDAAEDHNPTAVTPENVQEKTLTGSEGDGYTSTAGISLCNRTSKTVDMAAVATAGVNFTLASADAGPQILIMHTHTTEAFAQDPDHPYTETGTAHTTDTNYNITQVGDEIERIFTEMGLSVLHDYTQYDYPSYNGAYDRSRKGVEALLAQYPSIKVVLDVHRDAIVGADGSVLKPVIQVDGVKTAQVMILVGTDDAGSSFSDWTEHLALAARIQQQMNSLWPGLARPITLRTASFNEQLTKGSLLVEVGSHGNTLEEAMAGARLFARSAGQVLLELQAEAAQS